MKLSELLSEATSAFPTKSLRRVYHVGTMNRMAKNYDSYEGSGLSISLHPEEWRKIARGQVSGDLWAGEKANGAFLNFHSLMKAHKKVISDWSIQRKFATIDSVWEVNWYDDEMEDTMSMKFTSRGEAEQEAAGYGVEPTEIPGALHATDLLGRRTQMTRVSPTILMDILATVYVEDQTNLDGVWWQDTLDPQKFSAPRGVIVPNKISTWKFSKIEDNV